MSSHNAASGLGSRRPLGVGSILAAATGLVGGVGALTLTGALGRVQRNHGAWFTVAIGLVLCGAAALALSPRVDENWTAPKLKDPWYTRLLVAACVLLVAGGLLAILAAGLHVLAETQPLWIGAAALFLAGIVVGVSAFVYGSEVQIYVQESVQFGATILVLLGLIAGFGFAIATAHETQQPEVSLTLGSRQATVSGIAKASSLSSADTLNVSVEGGLLLQNKKFSRTASLYQAYIGPDGNGNVSDHVSVPIPAGRFDAVEMTAYTAQHPANCGATEAQTQLGKGTGCVIVVIPQEPADPALTATWLNKTTIGVSVTADVARASARGTHVLVQITDRSGKDLRLMYRSVMSATSGTLTRDIQVAAPAHVKMICVHAAYETASAVVADAKLYRLGRCPVRPSASVATVDLVPRADTSRHIAVSRQRPARAGK